MNCLREQKCSAWEGIKKKEESKFALLHVAGRLQSFAGESRSKQIWRFGQWNSQGIFFSNSCMWHYLNCLTWTHTWRGKNLLVSEERSNEEIAHVACLKGAEGNTELISFKDKRFGKLRTIVGKQRQPIGSHSLITDWSNILGDANVAFWGNEAAPKVADGLWNKFCVRLCPCVVRTSVSRFVPLGLSGIIFLVEYGQRGRTVEEAFHCSWVQVSSQKTFDSTSVQPAQGIENEVWWYPSWLHQIRLELYNFITNLKTALLTRRRFTWSKQTERCKKNGIWPRYTQALSYGNSLNRNVTTVWLMTMKMIFW